jgi:hypothetical protein
MKSMLLHASFSSLTGQAFSTNSHNHEQERKLTQGLGGWELMKEGLTTPSFSTLAKSCLRELTEGCEAFAFLKPQYSSGKSCSESGLKIDRRQVRAVSTCSV